MKVYEQAVGLCEEFTDFVLFDKHRMSIITNIDIIYFRTLKKEIEKLGYVLCFTKSFQNINTITCGFTLKQYAS